MDRRLVAGAAAIAVVAAAAAAVMVHHRSGATVEDLARVRLDTSPEKLASALPASEVEQHEVETHLARSVADFEAARFVFANDEVRGIHLLFAEKEEHARKSGHGDGLDRRFKAILPAAEGDELARGPLHVWLSEKELAFEIKEPERDVERDRTTEKVAVARDVLLAIAFGVPLRRTDKQVADGLGSGYPVADVASVAVTSASSSLDAVMARFPGSTRTPRSVRIPLVHPLVMDVDLQWRTRWESSVDYLHVDFHMTKAFRDRGALADCIAKQPATDLLEVRDGYGLGTIDESTAPKNFASLMRAVDACR